MRRTFFSAVLLCLTVCLVLPAQRPRRGGDRGVAEANGWIYGNLAAGLRRAGQTGKPLMVVVRCPP